MRTREVFEKLGFEEVWGTMTDQEPAYRYDFGNCELTATQVMSRYLRPIFLLGGVARDERSLMEIDFEMPLEVESFEQGVAFIAYALRNYHPRQPIPWVEQGRQWAELLPWERSMREYEGRPKCVVDWEWFRLAAKKLREQAKSAESTELVAFEFDGEVLRIKTTCEFIAIPAQGAGWEHTYFLSLSELDFLPKRIIKRPVWVSAWEGKLTIGNRVFRLMSAPSSEQDM